MLHIQPQHYDCWSQALEVTLGELIPGEQAREQAIKLWSQMRQHG